MSGLTRPLTRPLTSPLARAVGEGFASGFNPASLFSGGEQGLAYDFGNASTVYQDSARTTLVTAAGQGIGSVSDLSGRGNHATQATTASKALWQTTYAGFDGFDDFLSTAAINFTGTDKVTVVAGVRKLGTSQGFVAELTASSAANNGGFGLQAPQTAANHYLFGARGTIFTDSLAATAGLGAPHSAVITGAADITADRNTLRINGDGTTDPSQTDTGDLGTGAFANAVLYIGRRGGTTSPFNGRIYRLIIIGRTLTASELAAAERWCAQPAGVTLA